MHVKKFMQSLSRSSRPDAETAAAKEAVKRHNGDLGALLHSIVNDRDAPGARQAKLKNMVTHSSEFRRYLGINDPGMLERSGIHHDSARFRIQNQVIAAQVLAEVATLTVKEEYAARALDRLADLLDQDVKLDSRSRLKFHESAAEGFVCLAKQLPDMPKKLAHRATDIIDGNTSCFAQREALRVYKVLSELPPTQDKKIDKLANVARQREQNARSAQAASADNAGRSRLMSAFQSNWDGVPEIGQQIFREAERRGITVKITDKARMRYTLSHGGKSYDCCYSQTPLTPPSLIELCGDKKATSEFLRSKGFSVPRQMVYKGDRDAVVKFMETCESGSVVVKPAHGVGGKGVSVGVTDKDLDQAIAYASGAAPDGTEVLIEECVQGDDLRLLVIDYKLVAAAQRRPAEIEGDGSATIGELIESRGITKDDETLRCVQMAQDEAGNPLGYDSVLEPGRKMQVRKNANTSTGGTIEDITPDLDPGLREVAESVARAMKTPVVGFDVLAESADKYAIIEANEGPSLANHEPQPVIEAFLNLMFPHTA